VFIQPGQSNLAQKKKKKKKMKNEKMKKKMGWQWVNGDELEEGAQGPVVCSSA